VPPSVVSFHTVLRPRHAILGQADNIGHASPILCCAHSPTGKYAATGSGDATCRIWDMEMETPKWTLSGHKGWVLCVEWDSREKTVATGGHDGQVSCNPPLL
jgi:ribosome assembly protein 4